MNDGSLAERYSTGTVHKWVAIRCIWSANQQIVNNVDYKGIIMRLNIASQKLSCITFMAAALLTVGMPAIAGESTDPQLVENPINLSVMEGSANKGEIQAQLMMGVFYQEGSAGLTKDATKAFEWYKKAAVSGNTDAQFSVASMYEDGDGVKQDYAQAKKWHEKAAKQGNAYSQYRLGDMYYNGVGVAQNYAAAFSWYQKSASQGNMAAENSLGDMYRNGKSVPKSAKKAFSWYQKSAKQGYPEAQYNAAVAYINGNGVKRNLNQAKVLLSDSCDNGKVEGCSALKKIGSKI